MSRNVDGQPFTVPDGAVAPREGRVSRNLPQSAYVIPDGVAPREGRVSRNSIVSTS